MRAIRYSTAVAVLVTILAEIVAPIGLYAITSGPTQPDFAGFEPLGTTGMVNEFTGAFTYNIPLMEVPGPSGSSYPVSLSYHSGAAIEEDASWVGFGWSLNPGAINRGARGIPDDYNGALLTSVNRQDRNETFTAGAVANLQVASYDLLSFQVANRYNTFSGYSITSGLSLNVFNALSLNLESTNGVSRFSANINWANAFASMLTSELNKKNVETVKSYMSFNFSGMAKAAKEASQLRTARSVMAVASSFITSMAKPMSTPTSTMSYSGGSVTIRFGATAGFTPGFILGGANAGLHGNYTWQRPTEFANDTAYGYLYQGVVSTSVTRSADRMFEREGIYTNRDRYLSPGYFTADDFSVSGQGIGGSMRLVHAHPGMAAPQSRSSTIVNGTLGLEAGFGPDKITAGGSVTFGSNNTNVSGGEAIHSSWAQNMRHRPYAPDGNDRAFMRFLNDPADNLRYSSAMDAAHTSSSNQAPAGLYSRLNDAPTTDTFYRPRSGACISYRLNRELAPSMRSSATSPQFFSHAPSREVDEHVARAEPAIADGIGEISVTNGNGIRYVYGLPVYNRNERELTYTRSDVETMEKGGLGLAYGARVLNAQRPKQENVATNVSGTIKKQPYASMFLLTAIQTPDYVDRTMDGPTADDFGGYTRFTYARAAGSVPKDASLNTSQYWYKWRIPFRGYIWQEGNLTNKYDDRASVSMGEREMYYMSEIDTKTHTAVFITNKTKRTITVGGQPMDFNGSGRERNDAFESINTGNMDRDEEIAGSELWRRHYICGLDRDSANRFLGKVCGGRKSNGETITADLINNGDFDNKSQYLERIVLLAKDENGNYTHVVKTVNLEFTYETMQARPSWYLDNYRWHDAKKKNVLIENVNDWDSVYNISGLLNSRHYHTQQGVLPIHLSRRVAAAQYGKLTLKRIWTDYGDVRNATISPYEFIYNYRDSATEPYATELQQEGRLATTLAFPSQFVNNAADIPDSVNRRTRNDSIQNPAYNPAMVDAWGAYRNDGPTARGNRRLHLDQTRVPGKSSQFDPAAWQLKRIILPSGGEIEVHYEQNSYSFVQDRPVEAFVPIVAYSESGSEVTVGLDCSKLPASTADLAQALGSHVKKERLFFKFLFPFKACNYVPTQEGFPTGNSEYVSGFSNARVVSYSGSTITIAFRGSPKPKALIEEMIMNQGLFDPVCSDTVRPKTLWGLLPLGSDISGGKSTYERLVGMGGDISSWARSMSSFTSGPICQPYVRHSYVRIPCISKVGGGIRVRRIFVYDGGIEQGRAGMYGREYLYEREESTPAGTRVISSGVATNEPGQIREESALHRFIVGRTEKSFEERLASGEDLDQMTAPLCPSAWPGASIGYSRVVTRSIASGETSPGFTVSDFVTARDYPVIERATRLVNDRIVTPALPNPFLQVSMTMVNAGQGFTVITNQMHGKPRAVRQCAGTYSPNPALWHVVASQEHEYFEPGEKIPVLGRTSEGTPTVALREMGTSEELMVSVRKIVNNHNSITGNFDIGVALLFTPVVHAAGGSVMFSEQSVTMYVSTKLVSYACHEKRVIYRRDGMVRVLENGAFDEATGQPVISVSYDEYDRAYTGPGQIHAGAIMQMTYPAWHVYPQMGSAMTNENTRHGISSATSTTMTVSEPSASLFSPGDLVALVETMNGVAATAPAIVRVVGTSTTTVSYYVLSGTPSSQHRVATIIRSGKTNQLAAAAGTTVMHGNADLIGQNPFVASVSRRVLSASATTWNDNVGVDTAEYMAIYGERFTVAYTGSYERSLSGKWRPQESFVFRSGTESVIQNAPARSAGRIPQSDYAPFPYTSPTSRDTAKWVRTSRILAYTPDGDIAAEQDALTIPTTARFSHKGTLPSIIAKNADHASALFESFEDRVGASSASAHTGRRSIALTTALDSIGVINVTDRLRNDGLVARAWVRAIGAADTCHLTIGSSTVIPGQREVANVAGWRLIEWSIAPQSGALSSSGVKTVSVRAVGTNVYVDDVRLQPASSSATCYVYDPGTLRLVAQFDDQHFASLFKYSPEGRLTRKDRETEQGVFPLQEQHANSMSVSYAQRSQYGSPTYRPLMQRIGSNPFEDVPMEGVAIPKLPRSVGPSGVQAKGELFDVKLSPEKRRVRLFGDSVDLRAVDSVLKRATESPNSASPKKEGGNR